MAARRTRRDDGRYVMAVSLVDPDGARRRVHFYGRTQAEARAKAGSGPRPGCSGGTGA